MIVKNNYRKIIVIGLIIGSGKIEFDRLNYRIGLKNVRFTKKISEIKVESKIYYHDRIVLENQSMTMNRPRLIQIQWGFENRTCPDFEWSSLFGFQMVY